jgi:hypothetical protein
MVRKEGDDVVLDVSGSTDEAVAAVQSMFGSIRAAFDTPAHKD